MTEIKPIGMDGSALDPTTQGDREKRFEKLAVLIVSALGILSFAFWWPTFATLARFAFLCCFPAIFPFCYALVRSAPSLRERPTRRVLGMMIVIHCILLAGLVFAWRGFPSSLSIGNPDVVFGFMAVEVAAMLLLVRLNGHKTNSE